MTLFRLFFHDEYQLKKIKLNFILKEKIIRIIGINRLRNRKIFAMKPISTPPTCAFCTCAAGECQIHHMRSLPVWHMSITPVYASRLDRWIHPGLRRPAGYEKMGYHLVYCNVQPAKDNAHTFPSKPEDEVHHLTGGGVLPHRRHVRLPAQSSRYRHESLSRILSSTSLAPGQHRQRAEFLCDDAGEVGVGVPVGR